jgi:thiamine-phosphate pyrophosphorylase
MPLPASLKEKLDSARLYLVTSPAKPGGRSLLSTVEAALKGGVDMVQLREYGITDSAFFETACRLRNLTRKYNALFIVNNRPDIAYLTGADGVHVGQDDLPVFAARSIVGEGRIVGLSTHSPVEARRAVAEGADYIGVGPVFSTPTKEGAPAVGLSYVTHAAEMNLPFPFFAIGGIDAGNLEEVVKAGAGRVSVVRALMDAEDPESMARNLREALKTKVL